MAKTTEISRKPKMKPKPIVPSHIWDFVQQIRAARAIEKNALEEANATKDKRASASLREQARIQRRIQRWLARAARERMKPGNP